jgi:redox-sensitive bicupin YhaK (pirin superfamily)
MINIRRSQVRGMAKLDWLFSRHTFSFGEYRESALRSGLRNRNWTFPICG